MDRNDTDLAASARIKASEVQLAPNLIMGFATNTDEASVRIFAKSIRRIYSQQECHIAIITNRFEPYFAELAEDGVQFIPTSNNYSNQTRAVSKVINRAALWSLRAFRSILERAAPEIASSYPTLLETWHHPHFVRWFAYERFLDLNRHYNQVMLSDVKDVVFQGRIFDYSDPDLVCLCDQGLTYGEANWDTMWYREAYGEEELKKIAGRSPICIGTMIGPHHGILSIVRELKDEFAQRPFGRIEQAVFNHMILNGSLKTSFKVLPNVTGPIATLCGDKIQLNFVTNEGFILRAGDNSIVPAVHMYDRHAALNDVVKATFGI